MRLILPGSHGDATKALLESPVMNLLEVLRKPHGTLESAARDRRVWGAAAVVVSWAAANAVLTLVLFADSNFPAQAQLSSRELAQIERVLGLLAPTSAFLIPFVWWISVSALTLLTTRLFGGRPGFSTILAVVGVACAPWVAGYIVQLLLGTLQVFLTEEGPLPTALGFLALLVSVGSLVWHVVLVVIGIRYAAGVDYRGAAASCALTGLGCATAGFVLLVSVLTLVFLLSGAL
ncbi:MAG: YIP1 family protein [Rubrobacteraceae bacterium]